MVYRHVDRALRAEVFEAVRRAAAEGSDRSKASIVSNFLGRGVSRASLYGWVSRDMEDIAKGLVFQVQPLDAEPVAAGIGNMVERGAVALAEQTAIPYQQRLHNSLMRSDVIRAMAYGPDGRIRNVRLVMDADESERKKLQTAAIVMEKIAASQRDIHSRFIDELLDLVMAEIPAKRDQILQMMGDIRLKYGGGG